MLPTLKAAVPKFFRGGLRRVLTLRATQSTSASANAGVGGGSVRWQTRLGRFAVGPTLASLAGIRALTTFSIAEDNPIKRKLDAFEKEAEAKLLFLEGLEHQLSQLDEALEDWDAQDLSLVATTLWRMSVNASKATVLERPAFASPVRDTQLLSDLQRFIVLADSTYVKSDEEFQEFVGPNVTLVDGVWECSASKYTQSHARMVCHQTKSVVFAVRGSHELSDALLAMYVGSQPHEDGFCHLGVYRAAQQLRPLALEWLRDMMKEYPGYRPVVTGHSLGGATTCILTMLLQPDLPEIHGYAYNAPPTMTMPLAKACQPFVTSVVHGDDCVARVSYASMEMLRSELESVDWNAELKERATDEVQATRIVQLVKQADKKLTTGFDDLKATISGWSELMDARLEALKTALENAEAIKNRPHTDAETAEAKQAVEDAAEGVGSLVPGGDRREWLKQATAKERARMEARLAGVSEKMGALKMEHMDKLDRLKESKGFKWLQDMKASRASSESAEPPVSVPDEPESKKGSMFDTVKGWFGKGGDEEETKADLAVPEPTKGEQLREQLAFKGVGTMYHVVNVETPDEDLWALDPANPGTYEWFDGFVVKPTALGHHFAAPTASSLQRVLETVKES